MTAASLSIASSKALTVPSSRSLTINGTGTTVACSLCGRNFGVPAPSASTGKAPAPPCRLTIGGATTAGLVRKRNEDRFVVQHLTWSDMDRVRETALIVVADGLGGYEGGDKAAAMVMSQVGASLGAQLVNSLNSPAPSSPDFLAQKISSALESANRTIFEKAQGDANRKGMAATCAVVIISDGQVVIGHVGDCRVYHQRAEQLKQVTRDQTLVERMVDLGTLTRAEAAYHPARNQVGQAVGKNKTLEPASYRLNLAPGDCLVIACDGLHAHVDENMLTAAIRKAGPSASSLANQLVELANREGGSDNCTVVAVLAY